MNGDIFKLLQGHGSEGFSPVGDADLFFQLMEGMVGADPVLFGRDPEQEVVGFAEKDEAELFNMVEPEGAALTI